MKRSTVNGTLGLLVAAYIAVVVIRGKDNSAKLLALLREETAFLKWGAAALILGAAENVATGNARKIVSAIGSAAIIAAMVKSQKNGDPLGEFNKNLSEILGKSEVKK